MILRPPEKPAKPNPHLIYALETLTRLPLADAFYDLWSFLASDSVLADLFARHRGRCYEDQLSFHEVVMVIANALTRHHGSGRPAIASAIQHQQLSCHERAVYAKLGRLPLPLAEALLSTLSARLRPLFPSGMYRTALPTSLADLSVVVIDGKKIKKAAKRLLALRGRPGKVFGGKVLVAYLPAEGVAVAMAADPDGEANDVRLVPRLLPLARGAVTGTRLWVADRQFCNLDQPVQFCEQDDHYLIRHSKATGFHADDQRPAVPGTDDQGRAFLQEWGWLGAVDQKERRVYTRRITLLRPGQEEVAVVTDLLDEAVYPAEDLLATYLMRWQIELFFKECKSILGMVAYRFEDFVRVERWIDLALTTYLYLEWYRWGRLDRGGLTEKEKDWWQSQRTAGLCRAVRADREDEELRWLGRRLESPAGCKRLRRLVRASLPTALRRGRRAG